MKAKRARLVKKAMGKEPVGKGWFVLNAAESVWRRNEKFGTATLFEGAQSFRQIGINIHVLEPGQPNCHYHSESNEEDFLVLSGECLLLIDGKTVPLRQWDLVHCPPWTEHVFVGAGDGPCAILMIGARSRNEKIRYPRSALALKYGAGVKKTTTNPKVSYAETPKSKPARVVWPLPTTRTRRNSKRS